MAGLKVEHSWLPAGLYLQSPNGIYIDEYIFPLGSAYKVLNEANL